jgi:hypothetical protein
MKPSTFIIVAILSSVAIVGCAVSPSVIKGVVVMRTPTEVHVNLGSADGVQVGDTLTVFRSEPWATTQRNVRVGMVRVVKILDKNYSAVEVLRGTLYERDIVEKRVPY